MRLKEGAEEPSRFGAEGPGVNWVHTVPRHCENGHAQMQIRQWKWDEQRDVAVCRIDFKMLHHPIHLADNAQSQ